MAIKTFKYFDAGVGFKDQAADVITSEGVIYRNGVALKIYIQAAVRNIVTDTQSQTLTNKSISGATNTITSIPVTALTAIIDTDLSSVSASHDTIPSAKATKDYVDAQVLTKDAASEIAFTPAGTIAATNTQAAVEEVSQDVTDHLNDTTDAHDASAISNVPAGSIAATDVQAALNELDSEKAPIASPTFTGTVSGITAAMVGAPAGSGTSTGANTGDQTNITGNAATVTTNANLTGKITSVGNATSLGSFTSLELKTALTDETGSGSSVFSTSPVLTFPTIDTPDRLDMKKGTKSFLTTYALTATDGQLVFATDTLETFVVKTNALSAVGGGSGVGSVDIMSVDQADLSALTDYTQTGLEILESPSILLHGTKSFRLQHNTSIKSFKKVIAVDRKFRGKNHTVNLDVVSSATSGNLNILFYNETSASNLVASQAIATNSQAITATAVSTATLSGMDSATFNKLSVGMLITGVNIPIGTSITALNSTALTATLSAASTGTASVIRISALDQKKTFSFDIPNNCLSMSYTISSVVEASTESYIDDVVVQLTSQALSSTAITIPKNNDTDWTPATFSTLAWQGFGTVTNTSIQVRRQGSNLQMRGAVTLGTVAASLAQFPLPNNFGTIVTQVANANDSYGYIHRNTATTAILMNTIATSGLGYFQTSGGIVYSTNNPSTPVNGNVSFASSEVISFDNIQIPIAGWLANETESVTIPLTTAQLVQTPDSYLQMNGSTQSGSIINPTTVITSIGSAISKVNDTFVVVTAGIFNIEAVQAFTGIDNRFHITLNSTSVTKEDAAVLAWGSTHATGGYDAKAVWSGRLEVNDVIRFTSASSITGTSSKFSFSYAGSLKQLNPSSDSKITIPTHQLRFEGASTRGSTDTAIVKFDTQAITQGDAWDVVNTAANGTVVTMKKAGKLFVESSLLQGATTNLRILLNSTTATASSTFGAGQTNLNSTTSNATGIIDVKIGDVVRIYSDGTPQADSRNHVQLSLMETSIPANFSNVLPQWSQSDSAVRLDVGNGFGSTNTVVRRFANNPDNLGAAITYTDSATLGASLTINEDGLYAISYTDEGTGNTGVVITKNSSVAAAGNNQLAIDYITTTTPIGNASTQVYLVKGDVIRAIAPTPANITSSVTSAKFSISKVGKPNLTAVDVTPFVNMKTTDTQYITLNQTVTVNNATITGSLSSNTNDGVISYNPTTGVYTALKQCSVFLTLAANSSATNLIQSVIRINGVDSALDANDAATANSWGSTSFNGKLNAGEYFTFFIGSGSSASQKITVTAIADNNATASPTQQVSSDTLNFAFKSTAITTSDPVGTFNTYTYAINTQTATIATSAPTQTTDSMRVNGVQVFGRAYNAASTSASPARVDIFIGTGLKSKQVDAYMSAAKVSPASYDFTNYSATGEIGTSVTYSEVTGILSINGSAAFNTSTTKYIVIDFPTGSAQTNGYFVFNASKSPSLVTIPNLNQKIAYLGYSVSSGTNGGTTTASTWVTRPLNTLVDTSGIMSAPVSNQFVLQPGKYSLNGSFSQYLGSNGKVRLRNITDGTTSLIGTAVRCVADASVPAPLIGEIVITSTKTFEIQHWVSASQASNGMGTALTSGENEVYSQISIVKIQ